MSIPAMIALLASPVGAAPVADPPVTDTHAHDVRVDHSSGAIDARYAGRLVVAHRQVGAAAPNGRPSSLRCVWRADVVVDRAARHPSGSTMMRSITRENVMTGSRPGWCVGARTTIERDVASRAAQVRAHVTAVAADDRPVLLSEADSLHAGRVAG